MPGQALMHGKQKVTGDSSCQPPACTLSLYKLSNCKGWRKFVAWASCSATWKAMDQIPNKNTKVPEILFSRFWLPVLRVSPVTAQHQEGVSFGKRRCESLSWGAAFRSGLMHSLLVLMLHMADAPPWSHSARPITRDLAAIPGLGLMADSWHLLLWEVTLLKVTTLWVNPSLGRRKKFGLSWCPSPSELWRVGWPSSTPSPCRLNPGHLPRDDVLMTEAGVGQSCALSVTGGGRAAFRGGTGNQLPLAIIARQVPWFQSSVSFELLAWLWLRRSQEDGQWLSLTLSIVKSTTRKLEMAITSELRREIF